MFAGFDALTRHASQLVDVVDNAEELHATYVYVGAEAHAHRQPGHP